ncbi:hypothetical protein B0T13DRAFT_506390 [Neurospora crassa]|nr:hypothetical protein B0T13DRAFT_506390 [Neurospora crassa]
MRFPRFFQHFTTALLCGGLLIETALAKGDPPTIAVQTLIPQVDPTNTNKVTGIGVSYYPAASSIKHKSSGGSSSSINSKEGYHETEGPCLYVTTTAITFVDIVLPESSEDDDEDDDRGSNTEMMPTGMPTCMVFFFAAVLDVVIRGPFV